ncbi:Sec-independent protein translocase protein TatB [Henriciella litoralis]|uniref:Sec-independent protein translocase protein TatB n=1 Tax=Henriciella litoralis TaxID=568102 RepID=UPI000A038296|nr:Sec-independent protein translocase protein TatB [Henriciella litoralis]
MLPQFGFTEFMLVAIIALIVVGPKDLPMMMRKLGQFLAKGKAMAREFQSAFDDIAKQAELDELRKEIEDLRRDNALTEAVDELKRTEADINRQVMMESPLASKKPGPAEADKLTDEGASTADSVEQDTPSEAASAPTPDKPAPKKPAAKKQSPKKQTKSASESGTRKSTPKKVAPQPDKTGAGTE